MSDAVDVAKHHPTYMVHRRECWASCACGNWKTYPQSGNQQWAQQEFVKHLKEIARD